MTEAQEQNIEAALALIHQQFAQARDDEAAWYLGEAIRHLEETLGK